MQVSLFINEIVFTSLLEKQYSAQIRNRWQQMDEQHRERKREYMFISKRDGSIEGMVAITNVGLDD